MYRFPWFILHRMSICKEAYLLIQGDRNKKGLCQHGSFNGSSVIQISYCYSSNRKKLFGFRTTCLHMEFKDLVNKKKVISSGGFHSYITCYTKHKYHIQVTVKGERLLSYANCLCVVNLDVVHRKSLIFYYLVLNSSSRYLYHIAENRRENNQHLEYAHL